MKFEVEQKHRVDWDEKRLIEIISEYGGKLGDPIEQSDEYFAHPCRDFAQTDEALRIRSEGDRSFITYKGPKLDVETKTRREIELPIDAAGGSAESFSELLQAIGFMPVAVLRKSRRRFQIYHAGHEIEGAYDKLGELGGYIELELMADEADLERAKSLIADLARKLELGECERRSYLEMLLERQSDGGN